MLTSGTGGGRSEIQAWKHSLLGMANVLGDDEIPGDAGVAIEYQLPQSSKRIDFVITGEDASARTKVNAHVSKRSARSRITKSNPSGVSHPFAQNGFMDIASLEILVAAIEETSLSRGAERMHLVTSAASKRVSELERRLGTTLLYRHGRGVRPTPAGAILYQQAKVILRNVAQARDSLAAYASSGVASIRLVANSSTVLQFLPADISSFSRKVPGARVDLLEAFSYDVPRMVADGQADIGVYHAEHPASGVVSTSYRSDRIGLVVPVGHPLSRRKSMRFNDALDHDILGYFPRHSLEEFLRLAGATITRPVRVRAQVSNPEARCAMVREGLGLAVMPEGIALQYVERMGLVVVPLTDPWAERHLFVCVRDAEALSHQAKALMEHLLPS